MFLSQFFLIKSKIIHTAPLCAIISTTDIKEGDTIVQGMKAPDTKLLNECKTILVKEYQTEILELHEFIKMACPQSDTSTDTQEDAGLFGPFHQINQQYPGLKQIHERPDIYLIENFLSADECDRVIAKVEPHLTPCLVKNELTGLVEQDSSRTNTDANLPQSEAPTIVSKLTNLASCSASQLEILQVLRYTEGQESIDLLVNKECSQFQDPVIWLLHMCSGCLYD